MWLSCFVASSVISLVIAAGYEYLPPSNGYDYSRPSNPYTLPTTKPTIPTPPSRPTKPTYLPPPTGYPTRPPLDHTNPTPSRPTKPTYLVPTGHPSRPPPDHNHEHDHHHHDHDHGHEHHHHEPGMPFDFAYTVNEDGNDYSHNAISDGDVTRGEYHVALPDGRRQIVKYTADWKNGFNAEVSYEGEARYPDQPAGDYGPSTGGQPYRPPSQGGGYRY